MNVTDPKLSKRKTDSRTLIVQAAAVCFMKYGLEKATMDDMAHELGSTKGRVYHHFRSKNEIFFAVYRQAMQFCFDAVLPIVSQPIPANEKLYEMARAHCMVMMETLPFQRSIRLGVNVYLHVHGVETERRVLDELMAQRKEYEDLYRTVLQKGVEDGTLAVPDISIAGRAIMGALNSLVDWYRVRPDQSRSEQMQIADTLAKTIMNGLVSKRDPR